MMVDCGLCTSISVRRREARENLGSSVCRGVIHGLGFQFLGRAVGFSFVG